jgi:hypothetical protein
VTPSGCESYCSISKTDLQTFVCKSKCSELCKKFTPPNPSLNILNPVLNKDEQTLSKKNPAKAVQANLLSYKAEEICSGLFLSSLTDDESDAFALDLFKKSSNLNEADLKRAFLKGLKDRSIFVIKPNQKNWKKQNEVA